MPEYDNPEMVYGDDWDYYSFFYYWLSKYIIWINYTEGDFFKVFAVLENDEIFQEIIIHTGVKRFPVLVTPNGRYMGYLHWYTEQPDIKVSADEYYLELWIFEFLIDDVNRKMHLTYIKTITHFQKTYNIKNDKDFYYLDFLLTNDLDIFHIKNDPLVDN